MRSAFAIDHEPAGYRFRLRRSDGSVVVEGPLQGSRHECELDVRELEHLVRQASPARPHPELDWQARVSSP